MMHGRKNIKITYHIMGNEFFGTYVAYGKRRGVYRLLTWKHE